MIGKTKVTRFTSRLPTDLPADFQLRGWEIRGNTAPSGYVDAILVPEAHSYSSYIRYSAHKHRLGLGLRLEWVRVTRLPGSAHTVETRYSAAPQAYSTLKSLWQQPPAKKSAGRLRVGGLGFLPKSKTAGK